MAKTRRLWMTGATIVCLVSAQANATLFASEDESSVGPATSTTAVPPTEHFRFTLDAGFLAANPSLGLPAQDAHGTFNLVPTESGAFAGQIRQGRPYRLERNRSIAALTIGAIATITGAAILIYANRPECDTNQFAGGCGYGTKVVGGAVLTGGAVGLVIGALTWR
jgi:hypothetical protein